MMLMAPLGNLLVGLLLSVICAHSSLAFPPAHYPQHVPFESSQLMQSQSAKQSEKAPAEEKEQLNTVSVTCHPDSMEIVIKADMFGVGAPVNFEDLRLGVEHNGFCRATPSSGDEYKIFVGLVDCGTKHWMTEDSVVYTNLLLYSPMASPDGLIRMEEAVIPIECHYERRYSLSSSSLAPTWIPYTSTQAAVETLEFELRVMTSDWLLKRSSNMFYLGEPISIEASVRVGHHLGLRVYVSSCVASLEPDMYSVPSYAFIENGCLVDSQIPGSKSHFLPRTQDDTLRLVIDAFRFHNEDRGELYVTCHLNAIPVNDAEALNKACTLVNGRWRSADGNDYLCGYCQSQSEVGQIHSKFGPRAFGKPKEPEALWRSSLKTNTLSEQVASVGPVLVLPARQKSGPLPDDELPPFLSKMSRPTMYGSKWRSGMDRRVDLEKGLSAVPSTFLLEEDDSKDGEDEDYSKEDEEYESGMDLDGDAENTVAVAPEFTLKSKPVELGHNSSAAPSDFSFSTQFTLDVATLPNATATDSDFS